jgi:hypothetical protein
LLKITKQINFFNKFENMETKITKAPSMKKLPTTAVDPPYTSDKNRTYDPRPTFEISEAILPEIKKWTIDGEYILNMKVEMTGINEKDYGANKGKKCATFRVVSIGTPKSE